MSKRSPSTRLRALCSSALLVALVFAVYAQVGRHEYVVYDTGDYITENSHVLAGLTWDGFRWALTSTFAANWFPLTWLSHMLDVEIFGVDPGAHNLVNACIHALNSILCFAWLSRMTKQWIPSLWVAAMFAIHPLHVESVAWVVERKDVLSTCFGWLCLLAWSSYAERGGGRRYALALLLFGLGLLCKPMLVTWPFVLLLLDYWPLRREGLGVRRLVLEKLPFLALTLCSAAITVHAQGSSGAIQSLEKLPLALRLSNACVSVLKYLGKAVWPADLAFHYPHPKDNLASAAVVASVAAIVVVSAAAIWLRRRARYFPVGWFFFLGTLVPVIGIVQVGGQSMADRYTYIPLTGVFIVLAWGAMELAALWQKLAVVVGAAIVLALAPVTSKQVATWRNTKTMCEQGIRAAGDDYVAHNLLGCYLMENGDLDGAIPEFRRALSLTPNDADSLANLSGALLRKGVFAEAGALARRALVLAPAMPKVRNALAAALIGERRYGEALVETDRAIELDPYLASAHSNRAVALASLGRSVDAEAAYRRAIGLRPDLINAHFGLAQLLLAGRRPAEALAELDQCLRIRSDWAPAVADAVWILANEPGVLDATRAIALGERIATTRGARNAALLDALASAYAASGRFQDAIATGQRALERAREIGDVELAGRIERRVTAYRAGTVDRTIPR
jgi:tetratricopeptide (TPR) repeat protein